VIEEEADDAEVGFVVVEIEFGAGGHMTRENFREFLVLVAAWATGMQWSAGSATSPLGSDCVDVSIVHREQKYLD
jgi:hypothetical protein